MPQARGSQTALYLYKETTYKTDPGAPDAKKIYITTNGVKASQARIQSETLTGVRTQSAPLDDVIDITGPVGVEINSESLCFLLEQLFGTVNTTGTNPYTHTFTPGDSPVGFVTEKDYGSNISGAGRFEKLNGCRVASASFDFPSKGKPTASFDIKGAKQTLASSALDGTPTDVGNSSYGAANVATMSEGGSPIATIKQLSFTASNDLDEDGYVLGSSGERVALDEGFFIVTGSFTALFDSAALLTKAVNSTETSLKVALQRGDGLGSAGNEYFELESTALKLDRTSPEISGPKGVLQSFNFVAYGSNALKAVVKNQIATL